jgi:hypothetical protein
MTTIYVESGEQVGMQQLVKSAIDGEIARLDLALAAARKRLAPFEAKYGVTSEQFIHTMAAEDLEGNDDEYVQWAGEYRLWQRLQQKLDQLRGIEYRDPKLLRTNQSSH